VSIAAAPIATGAPIGTGEMAWTPSVDEPHPRSKWGCRGLVHMWPPQSLTPQRCDGLHAHRWLRLAQSDLRCLGGSGGVEVGHRNGVSGCS
jgi:hypothetical protein